MKVIMPATGNLDLNGDGKVSADELLKATMSIFWQLVVVLLAFAGGIYLLIVSPPFFKLVGSVVAIAAIAAFSLGVYRMLRYERMERREREDWLIQHEMSRFQLNQARGLSEIADATTMDQPMIDAAALQIMRRYYDGKEWSREAMVKAGIVSAEVWNEANALLKKRHIRDQRRRELRPETFADAWAIYVEGKLKANQHTVVNRELREAS